MRAVPPGPKGLPIIGNLDAFESDRLTFLTSTARPYGDVVKFSKNIYIIYSPELIEEIFVRSNDEFIEAFDVFQEPVNQDDDSLANWMNFRQAIAKGTRHSILRNYVPDLVKITQEVQKSWSEDSDIDIVEAMECITSRVIADYCFGPDASAIPHLSRNLLDALIVRIGNPFSFPAWLPTLSSLRIKRARIELEAEIMRIIIRRRATEEESDDLLTSLLHEKWPGQRPEDTLICRALMGTILAAHRVPAAAMSWVWYLLAMNPECEYALHQELDSVLKGQQPQGKNLNELQYTECVVKEALRLYPPTWLMDRYVSKPCVLGGYPLDAGQEMIFSPYAVHRDERYYDQPLTFRPERWQNLSEMKARPKFAYFPFGGGPRMCIGAKLSMVALVTITATIAATARLVLEPGKVALPNPQNTLLPSKLTMRVTKRERRHIPPVTGSGHTKLGQCPFHT